MPIPIDLQKIWQGTHRGALHSISSWNLESKSIEDGSGNREASITYVPTSSGATGQSQLKDFCELFPTEKHPFSPSQLTRFNNQYQVISCAVDSQRRIVTEEIVLSALHQDRLDYILPGLEATQLTFALPFVIIAEYAKDVSLLQQVRIYWDQSILLKQLGVFSMAFHNLIHSSSGNSISFENGLDSLPIVDGIRISRRLVNPTLQNCNMIIPLDALKSNGHHHNSHSSSLSLAKLCPIGGLDNINEIVNELPNLSPKRSQATRNVPHFSSTVFAPESEQVVNYRPESRHNTSMNSTLKLGDGSMDGPVQPLTFHSKPKHSIFDEAHESLMPRPSISIDPHRNESSVFKEPLSPFQPQVPFTERSRFDSKVFSNSPITNNFEARRPEPFPHHQLQSNIFSTDSLEVPMALKVAPHQKHSPFSTDDEPSIPPLRSSNKLNANQHLGGHFQGSGFSFIDDNNDDPPSNPLNTRSRDYHSNRSSIQLTDAGTETSQVFVNRRVVSHHQSKLILGDDSPSQPVIPSCRVSQPPGGRSTIFSD